MPASPEQAYRDIVAVYKTAWLANSPAIVNGPAPDTIYQADDERDTADATAPYVEFTMQHTIRAAATVSGGTGRRRYKGEGVITAIIYVPMINGQDTLTISQNLSKVVTDAFENVITVNGVEFFDVTPTELGRFDKWYVVNVTMNFMYTEIR